jgi:conserved hypothetical protein
MIKRIGKYVAIIVISIIALVGLYLALAFFLSRIEVSAENSRGNDITIYILSNGVHTDIVVPVRSPLIDWGKELKIENTKARDTSLMQYIGIGWGDKGFYLETPTWADLKFKTAFNAAFGLSTSAVHATYLKNVTESSYCVKLNLSTEQYGRLVKYIDTSFQKDKNGHYRHIVTNANYGNNDAFYEANNRYTLFNTCNTWTNKGLKICGQKACLWTPFDKGILYQYRKNKK